MEAQLSCTKHVLIFRWMLLLWRVKRSKYITRHHLLVTCNWKSEEFQNKMVRNIIMYKRLQGRISIIGHLLWVQGSEDQLGQPCHPALVSQLLELSHLLSNAWCSVLYSRHLIIFLECCMSEWLIGERHMSVCPIYLYFSELLWKNLRCGRHWRKSWK